MKSPPPRIPVAPLFTDFVRSQGGELWDDPKTEVAGKRADFLFRGRNVVAELKCLEKDVFNDPEDFGRLTRLIDRWEKEVGLTGSQLFQWLFAGKPLPPECRRQLIGVGKRQVEGAIRKAKRQLLATRNATGMKGASTVLFLANEGNTFFQHGHLFHLAQQAADTHARWDLSGLVYFSINLPASVPGDQHERSPWFPAYSQNASHSLVTWIDDLGLDWFNYYAKAAGFEPAPAVRISDRTEAQAMINSMRTIRRYGSRDPESPAGSEA